ncbi:hypothetical protein IPA_02730 [Ignicoccus pacificus DSM 13166]|uniref:DUF541 domain-containing protein n=1 Tax=Ignicoccus pacificus DSM 13166 TaxID=940294 RepID=A0A977KAT3_9CREN|nr:hypothetical protein IPA_02730 [Ignicoccus pacificus DSM 13166]
MKPEIASFSISCSAKASTPVISEEMARAKVNALTKVIGNATIYLTGFNSWYDERSSSYLSTYSLLIKVPIKKLGRALKLIGFSGCTIERVTFEPSRKSLEMAYEKALREAIRDALRKVKIIGEELNYTRIEIEEINLSYVQSPLSLTTTRLPSPPSLTLRVSVSLTATLTK